MLDKAGGEAVRFFASYESELASAYTHGMS